MWKVLVVLGSVVVAGVLICYPLIECVCDLKSTQINVEYSLIQELMFYKFKLSHNAMEATKLIHCVKGEGAVDPNSGTRWFRKFCWGCKNLDDQARLVLSGMVP